jgi:hypothetical protein
VEICPAVNYEHKHSKRKRSEIQWLARKQIANKQEHEGAERHQIGNDCNQPGSERGELRQDPPERPTTQAHCGED